MRRQSSSFAESTINLNNIEISSGHYKFNFPELPSWIIELFRDSNTLEEGIVGHRMMDFEKFLFQINELNFSNFEFSSSSSPLEIDKENTMSQFSNNKSIWVSFIGPNKMSISNKNLLIMVPPSSNREIIGVNEINFIKNFRFIKIMIDRVDKNPTLPR